jgi:hypothetical protein
MPIHTHLPNRDWLNDGWALVGTGVTRLWEALNNDDDSKYIQAPASKTGATVGFPVDITAVPEGAVVTAVTIKLRCATGSGTPPSGTSPSVTINVIAEDDTAKFTTRTIYPTGTPTTFEVATYRRDALGFLWDIHRINHILCRVFCLASVFDLIRCYKFWCEVQYRTRPTVTVTAPTGTVFTPSPVISWAYTQTDGDPQKTAEYKVFTALDQAAVSFNPETSPPVFRATVQGDVTSVTLPSSLNPDSYWVYVRAVSSFGAKSTWVGRQFTVSGPAPATPGVPDPTGSQSSIVDVVPDVELGSASLTLRDRTNLLSVAEADAEVAADGGGFGVTNTAVTRDTSNAFPGGFASWKMTSAASGDMTLLTRWEEVQSGEKVTARAQFKSAASARSCRVRILFYNSSFGALGGTLTGTSITDSTSTWTEAKVIGTSPADTAYARVAVDVLATAAANEVHYVDHLGLAYGDDTPWSDGGHASRNLLSSWYSTADGSPGTGEAWTAGPATTTGTEASPPGTGASGSAHKMTYVGLSPSIAYRAAGSTWNSATNGTDFTLNKPAGVVSGDLMLAFVMASEHTTVTPPVGWTLVNSAKVDDGTTDTSMFVLKRSAGGSEPASWTDGRIATAAGRRAAVVVAYSGAADASLQFIAENQAASGNATPLYLTTPALNNTDPNAWRIGAFAVSDDASGGTLTANTQEPVTIPPITYVGKSSAWTSELENGDFTILKPSGVAQGDLMIATVAKFMETTSSPVVTPPAGWTIQEQRVSATTCHLILTRYAGASEPASWSGSITGDHWYPHITQVVAYRNVHPTTPFIADDSATSSSTNNVWTPTVTNTDSRAWRLCSFMSTTHQPQTWNTNEVIQRASSSKLRDGGWGTDYSIQLLIADSNGPVSTGGYSRYAQHSDGSGSFNVSGWMGILRPLDAAPGAPPNETSRASVAVGASNPFMTLGVFDSNGVVASGNTQLSGIWTPGTGSDKNSMAGWIGLISPASPVTAGYAIAEMATQVDISKVDTDAVSDTEHVAVTASLIGTTAGTPYLTAKFYRANQLLNSLVAQGTTFGTSVWTKSAATFDVPPGTTRMKVGVSVSDRAINDIVYFDRVSLAFGTDTTFRPGTSRAEHPIWSKPHIQYADDSGTGYGDWQELPGLKANPPHYIPLSGLAGYVDHTVIPLVNRKYRARTISYGLNGDQFVSPWGPQSSEFSFVARNWWLKDIADPDDNIELKVKWETVSVTSTNTATVFQPLGEDLPVVLTEGYKGSQFSLKLIPVRSDDWAKLQKLLRSGRTLFLQSDIDNAWWVRPVGDLGAAILATSQRQSNPLREISISFVEVAPEL